MEGILRRDSNRTFRFGLSFLTPRLVVKKWGWCVSERAFIQFPFTFGIVRIATGGALYCSVASSYRSAPERSTSKFLRSDPCRCGYHVLLSGRYGRTHTAVTFSNFYANEGHVHTPTSCSLCTTYTRGRWPRGLTLCWTSQTLVPAEVNHTFPPRGDCVCVRLQVQ